MIDEKEDKTRRRFAEKLLKKALKTDGYLVMISFGNRTDKKIWSYNIHNLSGFSFKGNKFLTKRHRDMLIDEEGLKPKRRINTKFKHKDFWFNDR